VGYPANTIIEVRANFEANGQQCWNVLHYDVVGATVGIDIPDMLDGLLDNLCAVGNGSLTTELRKVMSEQVSLERVFVQPVWPTRYASAHRLVGLTGNRAGDCEAQNVAAVILKRGELGARSSQGRIHIGGLSEEDLENGKLTGGYKSAMDLFITNFLSSTWQDNVSPAFYVPCILNKTFDVESGKWFISGSTLITGFESMDTIRTMRRRTFRIGI
jgi:hypothetical protein